MISCRMMMQEDLPEVNAIYNESVAAGFQTGDLEPILKEQRDLLYQKHIEGNFPLLVACMENKVVGWISISPYREGRRALQYTCEISYYIEQKSLGIGIGSLMMKSMLEILTGYRFKTVLAILIDKNVRSMRLLEKFDFQRWGFLPNVFSFNEVECSHLYYGLRIKK